MVDTLETAADEGMAVRGDAVQSILSSATCDFAEVCRQWAILTLALNATARSLGSADPYPFVLSEPAVIKLRFIHDLLGPASHR